MAIRLYADVAGYCLEVGMGWHTIDHVQRAKLCNGVGAETQPEWLARLLGALPFLSPASYPHDVDYWYGGSEADRREADRRFRRNCYTVAKAELSWHWWHWFFTAQRRRWLASRALIDSAYAVLRVAGRKAFTYRQTPITNKE